MKTFSSSPIKSIQSGVYALTSSNKSANVTIDEVDQSKAVVNVQCAEVNATAVLVSGNELRVARGSYNSTAYVWWEVVEYA